MFTSSDATSVGYSQQAHHHNARVGNWKREYRGIYRLARYPQSESADLMLWQLWSRNRQGEAQGTYSHDTALAMYNLSDALPGRLHMTVPRGFDRSAQIPAILVLHRAHLADHEISTINGIRVTRPLRTLIDVIAEAALSPDVIEQAVNESVNRGLFTREQLRDSPAPRRVASRLRKFARASH